MILAEAPSPEQRGFPFLQEMTVRLKRNTEKIMSLYLTWFSIDGFDNN